MLLAMGISVALPQGASATVTGWLVNWCAPVACEPTRTYYQGMPKAGFFEVNASKDCSVGSQNYDMPAITNKNGGYLNTPEGFYSAAGLVNNVRWAVGEPIYCSNTDTFRIPFRYYRYDPVQAWSDPAGSTLVLGGGTGGSLKLQCLASNGTTINEATQTGSNAWGTGSFTSPINARPKTTDGKLSYQQFNWTMNGTISTLYRSDTNCANILSFTMTVPTDTIGGEKVIQWSGARAMNGVANTWPGDTETLNCNVQNPPQECIGQGTTPYLISCGLLTIDPGTWGALGPCIFGTPSDYIRGIGALDEVMDMPLPGSGSCSAFNAGTMFDTPVVFDLCGWYPAARPIFDVLMTAGLWIAVVGSVFKTRSGENN